MPNNKEGPDVSRQSSPISKHISTINDKLSENDFQEILKRKEELEGEYVLPLPLQRTVLPSHPFPFEALGSILGPAAKRIHEVVQGPDSIAAQSVLAAAAFVTQAFADVQIDGRVHPLSLFLLTAAESGDRKSATDKMAFKPICEYERQLVQCYRKKEQEYRIKCEAWNYQKQLILKKGGKELTRQLLEHQKSHPTSPLVPICLVEEPTFEGLQRLFEEGQPSLGLCCDEGGRMFGGYSMKKEEQLKTVSGLSSFWDGKPSTRVRAGGDNFILYGKRLTLHLMVQENVFNRIFSNEMLKNQGFLARCLIVYPQSMIGKREYQEVNLQNDLALQKYWGNLASLIDQPFPLRDSTIPNELQPKQLELEKSAKCIWKDYHNDLDKQLLPTGDFYAVRRFASKAPEQVLRIAGILTLFSQFDASFICEKEILQAVELVNFYLNEVSRIEGLNQNDGHLELAQESLAWFEHFQKSTQEHKVPISIFYQKGPKKIRNKELALRILHILQDHGYGQILENQEYQGKKHRIMWVPSLPEKKTG